MVVGFRYYLYRCRQLLYYHSWPKVREVDGGLVDGDTECGRLDRG